MKTTAYRYPNEQLILSITILLVLVVVAITATATVCLSVVFIAFFVGYAYYASRANHQELIRRAEPVSSENSQHSALMRDLMVLVRQGVARLRPGPIEVFIAPSRQLNAYTFGLSSPKVVVLFSPLLQVMDRDELMFILGHELGHVSLGHTWLNTLIGGMSGIPSPGAASAILVLAFLSWTRACEYSADRAGLLACGRLEKAITALIKLEAPSADTRAELEEAYRQIDAEDDSFLSNITEALGTHPMLIRRITELRRFAGTSSCRRLQELVNQNPA